MKNKIIFAFAFLFAVAANAQAQTQTKTQAQTQPQTQTTTTTNTTVTTSTSATDSLTSKYVSNPDKLKGITSETLKPENVFPALGTFKAAGSSKEDVTITLDETNKGMVWVNGLPQGKFKALLKRTPSTYKIPAQKTESGKTVAEGTLYVNPDTNELTIELGQAFNDANPTGFLTIATKKNAKAKTWQYTGVKTDAAVAPPASQQ